ncbi:MAG: serine/threonine protein kinase [Planctomycetes bacterium]|nr:serine/threonine protein kinase [Planctomycetota bacterium]
MQEDESTTQRPPSGSDHPPARPTEMNAADLRGGDRVAHYKILEPLGEGGFAVVYLADQEKPVRRRVALKIIKLGMDTKQVIARFEAERQALAMMDHPNVAKVFDAGVSETGRPYFVMEHVPGEPITNYCDRHRLTTRERLELLMQACEAVQHAHQKGIIHRDLKPANVLVTAKNGQAVLKVIDFGVAKALHQKLTERTLFTEQGQLIGTPEYMSPEQAEMGKLDIDTRSDIYSLGVLLYELLVGALPFDPTTLRKAAFGEIQRIIREVEPPKPSTRLSSLGDESTIYAEKRRADPRSLLRELRGDLDWITMKALEKDRTRRYATASELAADVERYLRLDPVLARPPSAVYRIAKFAKRNRTAFRAIVVVAATLILATVVSVIFAAQANIAKRNAIRERDRAEWQTYVSRIAAADAANLAGDTAAAHRHLSAAPVRYRGWEWNHLQSLTDARLMTLHVPSVTSVVKFNSDGTRIVTASRSGSVIKVWDTATGDEILTVYGRSEGVASVAISSDGSRIAAGANYSTIQVWDGTTGEELLKFLGHKGRVSTVAFSPDGTRLVSASNHDKTIKLWDAANGEELVSLDGYRVAFSPDGTRLASPTIDKTIKVWDAATGQELFTLRGHKGAVRTVAFSPDGTRIVSVGDDNMRFWDAATGQELFTLLGHKGAVRTVAFSPDGTRIVSVGDDNVRFWDAATTDELAALPVPDFSVFGVAFAADGTCMLLGARGTDVMIWDVDGGEEPTNLRGHESSVTRVALSPDGRHIASGSWDKTVGVWDVETVHGPLTFGGDSSDLLMTIAFAPDSGRIVSGSLAGKVEVWDAATGERLASLHRDETGVTSVTFSPDGTRIVAWRGYELSRSSIKVWDGTTGEEVPVLPEDERLLTSRSETRQDALVRLLHLNIRDEVSLSRATFSPNGRRFASLEGGIPRIRDAVTGNELLTLHGHEARVRLVAFSPDGTRIAGASYDGTIRVWDSVSPGLRAQQRREALAAEPVVDRLLAQGLAPAEVGTLLRADESLTTAQRHAALNLLLRKCVAARQAKMAEEGIEASRQQGIKEEESDER